MDRRHFIATVGVASAAVAASAVLEENWAHAEPQRDPDKRPPAVVDDRFLDTLTRINDLQVPTTLAGYQGQIDTLASPRALAQSAMRLVSAYVNPRGANHHAATPARSRSPPCCGRSPSARTPAVSTTSGTSTAHPTPRS